MDLTLQIYHHSIWHNAATLTIPDPERGRRGAMLLGYDRDYALEWLNRDDACACSLRYPVDLFSTYHGTHWLGFIDDIMPAGAARRYWVAQLGLQDRAPSEQDAELLQKGTIAPVGNLRIKESLPALAEGNQLASRRFAIADVCERDIDFLEYAQQMGAASGGATGAGGEAPKLVLRCSADHQVWIDTFQDDQSLADRHYLVKFPRGRRTEIDGDILRTEYHFYHELTALGIDTIDIDGMRLEEGSRYPSLWLPRFDTAFIDGKTERYGLESIFSVLDKAPGSYMHHGDVVAQLVALLAKQYGVTEQGGSFDPAAFVIEWAKRDLLNVAFGNSDNHGRNTALIKRPAGIQLAPIYDFAPMKADPEGVTRTTIWGSPLEEGGRFNWPLIAAQLAPWIEPAHLLYELGLLAGRLYGLRDRLAARGVPQRILAMPTMGFDFLDDKLKSWKLP
ncbi:HipA domain-containing protein [Paludibacterium sp.]|uniref:type II toxin-antitoxin system HipA family toxin n=1 Tax=Paludibacterium sp. TaxID=1917523 RepID=UPI0025FE29D0|nr:HipA domain-containing protein [Paludibacterium sp.]MBV8647117.1 type II toxin-antitoxin system HipA family toxin [Paludibacterium sp.]